MANVLPQDKQIAIISALTEGVSIRATERLTGVHRDTIMRLGVRIGEGCSALHERMMVNLQVGRVEMDETWSYVGKKQRKIRPDEIADKGDAWVFLAMEGTHKAILSYIIGKRNAATTDLFIKDLRQRIINRPVINSDGFHLYPTAVERYFAADVDYGQIIKHFAAEPAKDTARRYSPGYVVGVEVRTVTGRPSRVATSYIERQNLNLRIAQRRFTRLTNGFSKKLCNHNAAVALYVAHFNFCRVHETLRTTPAMAMGLTDHIWSIAELVEAATTEAPITDRPRFSRFQVIEGGLS
jgi:IS1 family transposase